jgi:pimeloyl-ACP methyl ester carboxylesterase
MYDQARSSARWLERGAGEPVVLLHGLLGAKDQWEAALDALEGLYRPIALDLPIFDLAVTDVSSAGLAEFVRRFMDAVHIPRAVVGGNSLGALVAIELARAHPERVSGLILTGFSGQIEQSMTARVTRHPTTEAARATLEAFFHEPSIVPTALVEAVRRVLSVRALARRALRATRSGRASRIEVRLCEIGVPTLLLWGKEDQITPVWVAERFHALIPDAELIVLPNCGHFPMLEQEEAFNAFLVWWLRETRPRRASRDLIVPSFR